MLTVVNKKTVVTALAVLALVVSPLVGTPASAFISDFEGGSGDAAFNTDPNDRPTLRVTNYTRNSECSTCWSYETAAEVDDIVSFDVYYHNTGDVPAKSTTASVSLSVNNTYIGATGKVDATNANAATGNANVNVTNLKGYKTFKLTPLEAFWYPNRSTSAQNVSVQGGVASLGTIGDGWDNQGHVVFRYKIEGIDKDSGTSIPTPGTNVDGYHDGADGAQPMTNCIANGWAADPDAPGTPVDVIIRVNGGGPGKTYVTKANLPRSDLGNVCTGGNCAFKQQLNLAAGVSHNITVSAKDLQTGQERELHRTDKDITCGGAVTPQPTETNAFGWHDRETGTQPPTKCIAAGWATDPDQSGPVTIRVSADGQVVRQSVANLPWAELAGHCKNGINCAFSENLSNVLTPNRTYTIKVEVKDNETGQWREAGWTNRQLTCTGAHVDPTPTCPAPTVSTGSVISRQVTSARVEGFIDSKGKDATYWVEFGTNPEALGSGNSRTSMVKEGSGTVNAVLENLQPGRTYYYRFVVKTQCGEDRGNIRQFDTDPIVIQCPAPGATTGSALSITSNSATITGSVSGNPSTVLMQYRRQGNATWLTAGAGTSVALGNLEPNTVYEYRIFAQSECGTATGNVREFQTTGGQQQCTAPTASTGDFFSVTSNSATITGSVSSNATSARFEYRRVGDASWITVSYNGGTQTLTGLTAGATYEYRIVAVNNCATVNGNVRTFQTGGGTCPAPTASTGDFYNVTSNSATITGSVTGNSTGQRFEYRRVGDANWITVSYNGGTQTLTGLASGTTYEYRVVADSTCGTVHGNVRTFQTTGGGSSVCQTRPSAFLNSNPARGDTWLNPTGSVSSNGSQTTYWFRLRQNGITVRDSEQRTLNASASSQPVEASFQGLSPNTTYTIELIAQNCADTTIAQTTATTGGGSQFAQAPTVITRDATNRSATAALLNGTVNPNGGVTTAWFEWSSSASAVASGLGTRVPPLGQPVGSGYSALDINAQIFGLTSGGTYYFRAVAENPSGRRYGEILRIGPFSTGGGGGGVIVTQPPIIVTTLAGGASGSCLTLTPSLNGQLLPGGEFVYGITYRNDCPFDLENTTLRNIIPNEVEFGNTNYPFLTRDLNVITYSLGTVPRNFQATILVRGIVKPTVRIGDTLIFRSELSFTDPQGRFQTISSTLPAAVGAATVDGAATGQVLGASIFDTLGGLFTSGWFWFLLFLLLLALFILWLATRNRGEDHDHE